MRAVLMGSPMESKLCDSMEYPVRYVGQGHEQFIINLYSNRLLCLSNDPFPTDFFVEILQTYKSVSSSSAR